MARSPLVYQIYMIAKTLPSYTFMDVLEMPHMLKELLYQLILYDYGTDDSNDDDDTIIDLDDATVDQIEKVLGAYKE